MKKFRKFTAVGLALVLCAGLLTGCGSKEEPLTEDAEDNASLSGKVTIVAEEGTPYASVSNLPDDYKISKAKDTKDIRESLGDEDCDFAVLNSVEAAKAYKEKDNFKVVTPVSLGQWQIVSNGFEKAENLSIFSGRTIHSIEKENHKNDNEKYSISEMSEEVLRALVVANKGALYENQMVWDDNVDVLQDVLTMYGMSAMGSPKDMSKLLKGNNQLTLMADLGQLWQENFKSDIPEYVLVVGDKFLEKRSEEVIAVLDDMAENLDKSQHDTDDKLVVYNKSNRGMNLVKDFYKVMEEYNIDAIGGEKLPDSFYFYK